jgi:hypothetical protein
MSSTACGLQAHKPRNPFQLSIRFSTFIEEPELLTQFRKEQYASRPVRSSCSKLFILGEGQIGPPALCLKLFEQLLQRHTLLIRRLRRDIRRWWSFEGTTYAGHLNSQLIEDAPSWESSQSVLTFASQPSAQALSTAVTARLCVHPPGTLTDLKILAAALANPQLIFLCHSSCKLQP